MKRKQLDHKTREIKWLIGRNSPLSLENKILIHKTIFRPVWTYGIELWGCANKSNIAIMQRYQSKLLRTIINAPWYVTNHTLHTDLHIPYFRKVIHDRINKHRTTLVSPPQPPYGNTAPTNEQQKTKTEIDLRPERLRWQRWTPT
jgi:hypothetical protein